VLENSKNCDKKPNTIPNQMKPRQSESAEGLHGKKEEEIRSESKSRSSVPLGCRKEAVPETKKTTDRNEEGKKLPAADEVEKSDLFFMRKADPQGPGEKSSHAGFKHSPSQSSTTYMSAGGNSQNNDRAQQANKAKQPHGLGLLAGFGNQTRPSSTGSSRILPLLVAGKTTRKIAVPEVLRRETNVNSSEPGKTVPGFPGVTNRRRCPASK